MKPKASIFFFSGTGNSWYVAKTIRELMNTVWNASLYAVENHLNDFESILKETDLIGLVYPIYGSDMPKPIKLFLNKLPEGNTVGFVATTQMMFSGDGANLAGKIMRKKGYRIQLQEHFNMPNNVSDLFLLPQIDVNYKKVEQYVAKKATAFVRKLENGTIRRKGNNPISLLMGLSQRIPYRLLEEKSFQTYLRLIDERCIGCGHCTVICPSHNLKLNERAKVDISDQCYLCYRCVNNCPQDALYMVRKKGPFKRYLGPTPKFRIRSVMNDEIAED